MNRALKRLLAALIFATCVSAHAQPVEAPKPKVYALISAVGDQFTIVTQVANINAASGRFSALYIRVIPSKRH